MLLYEITIFNENVRILTLNQTKVVFMQIVVNSSVLSQIQAHVAVTPLNSRFQVNETVYKQIPLYDKILYRIYRISQFFSQNIVILAVGTSLCAYFEFLVNQKIRNFMMKWFGVGLVKEFSVRDLAQNDEISFIQELQIRYNNEYFLTFFGTDVDEVSFSEEGIVFSLELFVELFVYPVWCKLQRMFRGKIVLDFIFKETFDLFGGKYYR